jgi:spermidine synthase
MPIKENDWFTEIFEDRTAFSVRCSEKLFDEVSDFQRVEIYDSPALGRVLILNGCFMVTEKDAFIYHEMLVHPAMAAVSHPSSALVVGGGDGGAVTELVKYPQLESITLCEIDPMVVKSCREYLPGISSGLDDPRVTVVSEDGAAYVRGTQQHYDLVLIDSTDPVGPGTALFEPSFFQSVKKVLKEGGAAVFQTESPLFMEDVFVDAVANLRAVFEPGTARPYLATVPCYPGGLWSFTFCSNSLDLSGEAQSDFEPPCADSLKYYDKQVHRAAFTLPRFVRQKIESVL